MRQRVAVLALLTLAAAAESWASPLQAGEVETGVRLDATELLAQGWRPSVNPEDFPLRNERKSLRLLAGFEDPSTGARIFVLHTMPSSPLPLSNIDNEPPEALLAHLGATRAGASGRFEKDFLGPGLDAIHWTIRSSGDGVTFLPANPSPRVETFGLRTILSFGVIGPGHVPRRVVLSAFLRCESVDADRLTRVFFDLLRTLQPSGPSAKIVPESQIPEPGTEVVLADLFARMGRLIEQRFEEIGSDARITLSGKEAKTVEDFLEVDPEDHLARRLFLQSQPALELGNLQEDAREAYLAYVQTALRFTGALSESNRARAFYAKRIEAIDPEHRLAYRPPAACADGEHWVDATTDRRYTCSDLRVGELTGSDLLWLPDDPSEGDVVTDSDQTFRWHSGFESWLPAEPEAGTVVSAAPPIGASKSLIFLQSSEEPQGRWLLLRGIPGQRLLELVGGARHSALCPEPLHPMRVADIDLTSASLFIDGLAREEVDALLFEMGNDLVLVRVRAPEEQVVLETRRAARRWRRARISVLCLSGAHSF